MNATAKLCFKWLLVTHFVVDSSALFLMYPPKIPWLLTLWKFGLQSELM